MSRGVKCVQVDVDIPNLVVAQLLDVDMYVVSVYRLPSYSAAENLLLRGFVEDFVVGREVVFLGDFNLASMSWPLEDLHNNYISLVDREFLDCFRNCGLTQWVNFGTYFPSGNILDLVLSTDDDRIFDVLSEPPFPACHHVPVLFKVIFQLQETEEEEVSVERNWFKADISLFSAELWKVEWELLFDSLSVEECYSIFMDILGECTEICVPRRRAGSSKSWLSTPPARLKRDRKRKWLSYKSLRSSLGRDHPETLLAYRDYDSVNYNYRNYTLITN